MQVARFGPAVDRVEDASANLTIEPPLLNKESDRSDHHPRREHVVEPVDRKCEEKSQSGFAIPLNLPGFNMEVTPDPP